MHGITFSSNQQEAIDCVIDWYSVSSMNMPYITLGGYAGTGKTTVVAEIIKILAINKGAKIAACCLTGKAVSVLKKKLDKQHVSHLTSSISTVHKLIYTPRIDSNGIVVGFDLVPKKRMMDISLIVVDESSMISMQLYEDLLSFGIPVLFVGDHGQLGPVETNSYIIPFNLMRNPSLKLEEVFRFGESADLIDLSERVRNGDGIPLRFESKNVRSFGHRDVNWEWLKSKTDNEVIITGTNKTRNYINELIRRTLGFCADCPMTNDKLIITKNVYTLDGRDILMFNGQFAMIERISWNENCHVDALNCTIILEESGERLNNVVLNLPKLVEGSSAFPYVGDPDIGTVLTNNKYVYSEANFGYAITCHKAQGSEWDSVMVFDDGYPFNEEEHARWLYTAITRTSGKIGYCKAGIKELSSTKTFNNVGTFSINI